MKNSEHDHNMLKDTDSTTGNHSKHKPVIHGRPDGFSYVNHRTAVNGEDVSQQKTQ